MDQSLLLKLLENYMQDEATCPAITSPADASIYYMMIGNYRYKQKASEPNPESTIRTPVTFAQFLDMNATEQDVEKEVFRFNQAFRAAITRNKAKLEKQGAVIPQFKTLFSKHTDRLVGKDNEYRVLIFEYIHQTSLLQVNMSKTISDLF